MKKQTKSKSQKYYKNKCDKLISNHFKGQPCIICGEPGYGHHLNSRSKIATRHSLLNIVPLCSLHHCFSNDIAPHSANAFAVQKFIKFIKENYPEKFAYWRKMCYTLCSKVDYKERYENLLKELEIKKCVIEIPMALTKLAIKGLLE